MSTSNSTTDPGHHAHSKATSPSSTDVVAVADVSLMDMSSEITAPIFSHLRRSCTIRELVQMKLFSKTWTTSMFSNNELVTAKAHWEDDTKDWYFPIRFDYHEDDCNHQKTASQNSWLCQCTRLEWRERPWTWSGVHHSSGEIHRLPPGVPLRGGLDASLADDDDGTEEYSEDLMDVLRLFWRARNPPFNTLIASSGGLLLFIDIAPTTQLEVDHPYMLFLPREGAPFGDMLREHTEPFLEDEIRAQRWRPLVVCNPLTKEWRILPAPDSRDVGRARWDYSGFRAHMVVDEKANAYKVMVTLQACLCVYMSTSNTWTCRAFPQPAPFGFAGQRVGSGFPVSSEFIFFPSAIVGGKLHFAELETGGDRFAEILDPGALGCVKVHEIDEEVLGTWKPPFRYNLRNYFSELHSRDYGFRIGSCAIGIVECMGCMFVIIPARLDVAMSMEDEIMRANHLDAQAPVRSYSSFGYLPLQFYLLRLCEGANLAYGQLLVQIPRTSAVGEMEYWRRRHTFLVHNEGDYLCMNPHNKRKAEVYAGFRYTARGSVIWVTWLDYLLQYDVVSGESKTRILPDTSFAPTPDLSYRPSFYMKP